MNASTTIKTYPVEELKNVIGYSEENERIRQLFISRNTDLSEIEAELDAKFKNMAIKLANSNSDNYDGGFWDYNEHGLLTLVTSAETLEFDGSYRTHETTPEEFSFAISLMATNQMLWTPTPSDYLYSYFEYLYHLSHCILGNATKSDSFDPSKVSIMID